MVELLISSSGSAAPSLIVRKHVGDHVRLTHQVRWLTRAQGPGVVRLHDVDSSGTHYSTHFGGRLTLAAAAADPAATLPLLADVWAALERLHRLKLVHGAVAADHVVVGAGGPLLLSPGEADAVDRRIDIACFGTMVAGLAEVWAVESSTDSSVIARWQAVGRRIGALGTSPLASAEDRLITGAEVRRLLAELPPHDRSGRRLVGRKLRRRRRYG